MEYHDKDTLRKSVFGFLKQRKRFFETAKLYHMSGACQQVKTRMELIERYGYWRQCLEVKNAQSLLKMLLPSVSGGHATERRHMEELIDHCCKVASVPASVYARQTESAV